MTSNQYKNIVNMTLNDVKNEKNMDSAELARRVMNNCGVSLPNASVSDIADALSSEEYMGWRKCTIEQAVEYANVGTPVIGVDVNGLKVVVPNNETENQQEQNAENTKEDYVVSASNLSANMQYYAYYAATTTTTTPKVSFQVLGCPKGNLYVGQSFDLVAFDEKGYNSVPVTWEYDKSKFVKWEEFVQHSYYAHFTTLAAGTTTIKATYKGQSCTITFVITALGTVKFDANGGCVSLKSESAACGNKITLPTPTYDGDHIFMGWFTGKENTDKAGNNGDQYTVRCSTTLYAQWLFLRKRILSKNACYIANKDNKNAPKVAGIMVHSTAADNSSIGRYVPKIKSKENAAADKENEVDALLSKNDSGNHWNVYHPGCRENDPNNRVHAFEPTPGERSKCKICGGSQKCVNAFVGKLEDGRVAVYQTLPWDMPGWHSGSYNDTGKNEDSADDQGYIGFEICENKADDAYLKAAYHEAVKLCAYLCKKYGIKDINKIISHKEGYDKKIASNHGDPDHWFKPRGYSMDGFRRDVKNMM